MSIRSVVKAIKKGDNFLVTSHINVEADALCSQLAVIELLKRMNKRYECIHSDTIPECYKIFSGTNLIKKYSGKKKNFDAAIVLDCATKERAGKVQHYIDNCPNVINIDHHVSNNKFGNINWIMPKASSTGEMLYYLFKEMNLGITKKIATYIYAAMITDTGSFNHSNTTAGTHLVASDLIDLGVRPEKMHSTIFENRKLSNIRLLSAILSTLRLRHKDKIALMYCDNKILKKTKSCLADTENFINMAKSLKTVKIAVLVKQSTEDPKMFNLSLRSKGSIDVNKLAKYFNGGGHRNAAGCVLRGNLNAVMERICKGAKKILSTYGE